MKNSTYLFAILSLLGFVLSCERGPIDGFSTDDSNPESLVNQAKSTFDKEVNRNVDQARLSGSGSNVFQVARWQPQWHQAVTFLYQGAPVVEVPILYDGVDISYKMKSTNKDYKTATSNGVTKLVFFKHKDKSMASYII